MEANLVDVGEQLNSLSRASFKDPVITLNVSSCHGHFLTIRLSSLNISCDREVEPERRGLVDVT